MGNESVLRLPNRKRTIQDLPAVRLNEARFILGLGGERWTILWDTVYQYTVVHFEKGNVTWVNLDSLVKQVYPATAKDPVGRARVAHDFMWKIMEGRLDRRLQRLNEKLKKYESDEGEQ